MNDMHTNNLSEMAQLSGKYLTFRIASEDYGINVNRVREIVSLQPITRLPNSPECVRGVMNLRGTVVTIVDLRVKFGFPFQDDNKYTCLVIVESHDGENQYLVGIIVDAVSDVMTLTEGQLQEPPAYVGNVKTHLIQAMAKTDKGVRILLNIDALLSKKEIIDMKSGAI